MKGSKRLPGMWFTKIVIRARPRQKSIALGSRIVGTVGLRARVRSPAGNAYAVAIRTLNAQHGGNGDGIGRRTRKAAGDARSACGRLAGGVRPAPARAASCFDASTRSRTRIGPSVRAKRAGL